MSKKHMSGAEAFAEMVHGYGVTHAFLVPNFALKAHARMNELGVQTVSAHGEKAAAYMADGYARMTGKPGLCMAQAVGGALVAAGLKDAYMAGAPVVAVTGGPDIPTKYRHVYQEIDDYGMLDEVTKWRAAVEDVTRLPELLRQAFRAATSGAPGPVALELRGHLGGLVNLEAELDSYIEPRFGRSPAFRPVADQSDIQAAVDLLTTAKSPVIVAGGGVIASRGEAALVQLAEKLDIPVTTSLAGKAIIDGRHPLSAGIVGVYSPRCGNDVLSRADVVFFIGCHPGSMVSTNWQVPTPGTTVIHLDINPEELGRHYPTEVALMGDARATLEQMSATATDRGNPRWLEAVGKIVGQWRDEVRSMCEDDLIPIRPERICTEIAAVLPEDGAIITDTLQASAWAGSMMVLKGASQRFVSCAGSLGWALPAAIGAKCGLGDRPVVCFSGDGGFYYHLAELETAARYNVNVVFVVNNNGAYAHEINSWEAAYGVGNVASHPHWQFGDRNFAAVAENLGCTGVRVDRPEHIGDALKDALSSAGPVVIDVLSDFTAFHPTGYVPAGGKDRDPFDC